MKQLPGVRAIALIHPAQIGGTRTMHAGASRAIPRVRSQQCDPRNDSGSEIPGWSGPTLHKTPALSSLENTRMGNPESDILKSLWTGERIVYAASNRGR